jgi:hypothetical protein
VQGVVKAALGVLVDDGGKVEDGTLETFIVVFVR